MSSMNNIDEYDDVSTSSHMHMQHHTPHHLANPIKIFESETQKHHGSYKALLGVSVEQLPTLKKQGLGTVASEAVFLKGTSAQSMTFNLVSQTPTRRIYTTRKG